MNKEQKRIIELVIFGTLQYVFLPVLCGFLAAAVLSFAGLERLGLDIFKFTNFPKIYIQTEVWTNYSGLELAAGLGGAIGMILSWFLRFGTRLGHFDFIGSPPSVDAIPIPSVAGFVKSIIRIIGIPIIIVLAALTSLKLAQAGLLPGVNLDIKSRLFEVTLTGVVTVAASGCLLMFLYDMALTMLLRTARRKDAGLKELE